MGKNSKRIIISAIVLLYSISFSTYAQAGFFNWLANESVQTIATELESDTAIETGASFESLFSWNSRESFTQVSEEPKTEFKVVREAIRQVTAYNVGDPYQTDSTPCIGAYSKVDLCEEVAKGVSVCAANFVPLGTMLRIYTDEEQSFECVVWDRMASRFSKRVDIAMSLSEKNQARQLGLRKLKVQILEEIENDGISI